MKLDARADIFKDGLLEDTLPFWIRHAVDREQGGFIFSLDRDGTVVDTDKPMWIHGRFTWLLSPPAVNAGSSQTGGPDR